ncbi:hypothetical protein [Pararhodonellum marinum]|uniref:hypothetical protein n=1 Tax=Pararhodonellum marinum TaxID=2755358 RepID=UPI0018906B1D|nr:hypothetical protein [Pararhodonellum marinum]
MKKPKQEEFPRSVIKGSGVVHADLSPLNGKGSLLFVSPQCVVVGLNDFPYKLFTTPEFRKIDLPTNIKESIFEVKELVFQATFSIEGLDSFIYCPIPDWVKKFKVIHSVRFEYIEIDNLIAVKDLPIQQLVLKKIRYKDCNSILATIKQFKDLKEIFYDHSISSDLEASLIALSLKMIKE